MKGDAFFSWLIRPFAGSSRYAPQYFWKKASKEAQALANWALAPFENSSAPVDYHAHLLGNGDGLNPPAMHNEMLNWKSPLSHIRYLSYLSAIKLKPNHHDPDSHIRKHIHHLVKHLSEEKPHRMQILAMDNYYTLDGIRRQEKTQFYVSNDYLLECVREYPETFTPVFSVHPYRIDALSELTRCHELFEEWRQQIALRGVLSKEDAKKIPKMLKWLPNAMGIDPSSPKCTPFYEKMQRFGFTLLSHTGEEMAVSVDRPHQLFGNPLLLRKPLNEGVNVIIAHCASLGKNPDLDNDNRLEDNFTFFVRMMKESLAAPQEGRGKLYGDISALSVFMLQKPLCALLGMPEFHHRLLNGSDFPLPAINILVHLSGAKWAKMITSKEASLLREIYHYNPLLMDITYKRLCRHPKTGQQFPEELFTRLLD